MTPAVPAPKVTELAVVWAVVAALRTLATSEGEPRLGPACECPWGVCGGGLVDGV